MVIAIDLGSNTFRAALVRAHSREPILGRCSTEDFENVKVFERIVGSARELAQTGKISIAAKERIFEALRDIQKEFDFVNLPCVAVATQAFRVAKNAHEIADEIWRKFGVKFEIISSQAEAKLTAIGVQNALKRLNLTNIKTAFIDLGGASCEIGDGREFRSFEFGIITFYEKFCTKNGPKIEWQRLCIEAIEQTGAASEFLQKLDARRAVLTSGVPTTMAAMKQNMCYADYDAVVINGSELNFGDFERLANELLNLDKKAADELVGVGRAMPVVAGMGLLSSLLTDKNLQLIVIDDGLREGLGAAYLSDRLAEILKI